MKKIKFDFDYLLTRLTLIALIAFLIASIFRSCQAFGQTSSDSDWVLRSDYDTVVINNSRFNYIVEYKEWHDFNTSVNIYYNGNYITPSGWVHNLIGFYSYDDMIKWLNGGSIIMVDGDRVPRLSVEEFICAYDVGNMKVIELQLIEEHKERRIVQEKYIKKYWK